MSSVTPQRSNNDGPQPHLVISAHDDDLCTLAYLPDGRVVTGSNDGTVRVWNLEIGEQEGSPMKKESGITSLAVTRDGTKIIGGDHCGEIKIWDVESHELVQEWTRPGVASKLSISPDDRLIAVADGSVTIHTTNGRLVNDDIPLDDDDIVGSVCFSPDGNKLACGSLDGNIFVYDVESGQFLLGPLKGHDYGVVCVLWSHDGTRLFSADDKTIRCWNSHTGEKIGLPWTGHTDGIYSLSLSPDGSILASVSGDRTVRFWDVISGNLLGKHLKHPTYVNAICFSPNGEFVASAGGDGRIYLWRVPWLDSIEHQSQRALLDHSAPPVYGGEQVFNFDAIADPSLTARPFIPSALPNTHHTFTPAVDQPGEYQIYNLNTNPPPPPDLTPYISRNNEQYVAGGAFGDVYRCHYTRGSASTEVAVKAFRFRVTIDGDKGDKHGKMLRRELGIWKRLNHTNVVPFLGIAYGFGMTDTMSLVSLWMPNESLHTFLTKHDDNLGVVHRLRFLLDIANGLQYMHSLRIVHGDLNCNNVLLDADYNARLADFCYASLVRNIPEALSYLQRSATRPVALRWSTPEQITSGRTFHRTAKSDIYSFGCICLQGGLLTTSYGSVLIVLQVLSGKQPWSECQEEVAIVLNLAKGQKPGRPESRVMDDSHWNFIQDCWSPMEDRPAAGTIIFIVQQFLSRSPSSRPLRDLLISQSSCADSLVDESSSSLSQATVEGLKRTSTTYTRGSIKNNGTTCEREISQTTMDMLRFNEVLIEEKEVICRWVETNALCDDSVKTKDFKAHLHHKHGITSDSQAYPCLWYGCSTTPMKGPSLERHIKEIHVAVKWPCPHCSNTFTRERTLIEHIRRMHRLDLTTYVNK